VAKEYSNVKLYKKSFTKYFLKVGKLKKIFLFDKARNYSLSKATKKWILILDCDETIKDPNQIKELTTHSEVIAWRLDQISTVNNVEIPTQTTRLWQNGYGIHYTKVVHETVDEYLQDNKLRIERSDAMITHTGFDDPKWNKEKAQRVIDAYEYEQHPYMWYYLGIVYTQLENPEKASECFEKCIVMPNIPKHLKAHALGVLADCYRQSSLFYRDLAVERIKAGIELEPDQNMVYLIQAELLKNFNKPNKAKDIYKALRKRDTLKTKINADILLTKEQIDKEIKNCTIR